jgi:hypothetical protein
MPENALPFLGQARPSDGQELFLAMGFPEATCVGMTVEGQNQPSDRPMELAFPVLVPPVFRQGNPSLGAKQECLRVSALGITRFNGVAWEGTKSIQCCGGVHRRGTGTKFTEFRPVKIRVLDVVTKKDRATFHLPLWAVRSQLAALLVARLDNTSEVDRIACCASGVSDR